MAKRERLNGQFAVFNLHVNDAGKKADAEFIAQFGQEAFDQHIKPYHDNGIMSLFNKKPTPQTFAWVALVTAYANAQAFKKVVVARDSMHYEFIVHDEPSQQLLQTMLETDEATITVVDA